MFKFPWFVAVLCATTLCWGQGRPDDIDKPLWDEERAFAHLKAVATGPWMSSDWGLKLLLSTGKGASAISAPVEILGGWTEETGRWQRLLLPDGVQWLIKGASVTTIWKLGVGQIAPLGPLERHAPIMEDIPLDWDLYSMSFLSWPEHTYLGVNRTHGRWADCVELKGSNEGYAKADVWIDTEFSAPLEAQLYDSQDNLVKTLRIVSMQKVGSDWILKRWEVLDNLKHTKTTLTTTAIVPSAHWSSALYNETALIGEWPEPAAPYWKELSE
jgi:hypothetical protein